VFATKEAVKFSLTASFVANGLSIHLNFIVQQLVKRNLEQRGNFAQHDDVGCFFSALQFPTKFFHKSQTFLLVGGDGVVIAIDGDLS
jgi:hypothetical protein